MLSLTAICGVPRAGSTLLANVLAQNPAFKVRGTSPVVNVFAAVSHSASHCQEVISSLAKDKADGTTWTRDWIEKSARGVVEAAYGGEVHAIDKSRGWGLHHLALKQVFPKALIIACVRDLRGVMGSIEKRYLEFPLLDQGLGPLEKTLQARVNQLFAANGMVGQPVAGVEDLLRRKPKGLMVVDYQKLSEDPGYVLGRIYEKLGVEPYEHDFENVEPVTGELDQLWLEKFPHDGCGKVRPGDPDEWKKYVSADMAALIQRQWGFYTQRLGYVDKAEGADADLLVS